MNEKLTKYIKPVKIFVSSFVDKELTLFAASLSFYTIFTIIPLLLIVMAILTALPSFADYYEKIQGFIFSNLMPVNSDTVMFQINGFLQNASKMGAIGLVAILVSSLLFFKNFEYIANRIFHAKPRTLWESITTYWTLLTLTPIALGVSFYITGYIATLMASNSLTSGLNILPLVPYIIIWGLFFLIFQIAANAKINPKASLISSFIVSVIFSISKNAFIYYVFLNKSYTTMYGSFAILMFLFLWIYVSWIIFLYGLKLCHIIDEIYKKKQRIAE
ncbi:YihY family inner membrane protein [Sulfurimonas sp. SWIR-19]|uniref:YihY family inner membrane protein n=1 Tax=Sulfurimonas sp. SWIR-19 TaxID=2878390 RepID=UPI001CF35BD2|nr:YihY family inner membrane protein [Sulfurimonas sp. SWIR-19]UCN00671.1 YihY family inner membrane protein [Sulfurimonas sp. SWIR-19]